MPLQPSGKVVRDAAGLTLLVQRTLPLSAEQTWEWLTVSAKLRKWIGGYRGKAAPGGSVDLTMTAEDGSPTLPVTVMRCDPQSRLVVDWAGQRMTVAIAEVAGATTVYFSQPVADWRDAGTMGPGWEWYFDRLVAAAVGGTVAPFEEYLAVQRPYYERLALDGEPIGAQTETGR